MPQLSKGETFVDGQQVNGVRLNDHVDNATALPGIITDQTDIASVAVTGRAFTSADGKTVTVTSIAHGLTTGFLMNFTASVAAFSGRYTITVVSVNTFSYSIPQSIGISSSGTLDYVRLDLLTSSDSLMVYDLSDTALKKATFGNLLNSRLDADLDSGTINTTITSVINGKTSSDVNVTPNEGIAITGKAFNSVDGITAVVTSVGHGLETGMLLDVTASNAVYTGQHFITYLTVDTFSFVISQPTPVAASGTLSYTKKASMKLSGNQYVSGKMKVEGELLAKNNLTVDGNLTSNANANFTGTLQVNGSTAYTLIDVFEETIPPWVPAVGGTYNSVYTSSTFYKPTGEIWVFELYYQQQIRITFNAETGGRYSTQAFQTGEYIWVENVWDSHSTAGGRTHSYRTRRWVVGAGTALGTLAAPISFKIDAYLQNASEFRMFNNTVTGSISNLLTTGTLNDSKFVIYKYKTA